jgi:hypothetical protein
MQKNSSIPTVSTHKHTNCVMSERERKSLLRYTEAAADVEIKETPECVRFLEYYTEREKLVRRRNAPCISCPFFFTLFFVWLLLLLSLFDRVFYT